MSHEGADAPCWHSTHPRPQSSRGGPDRGSVSCSKNTGQVPQGREGKGGFLLLGRQQASTESTGQADGQQSLCSEGEIPVGSGLLCASRQVERVRGLRSSPPTLQGTAMCGERPWRCLCRTANGASSLQTRQNKIPENPDTTVKGERDPCKEGLCGGRDDSPLPE